MSTPFIPALELCRRFYREMVHPILERHYPGLPHSAALLGSGSELLGFDDAMSTDHGWGPRLQLFLRPSDYPRLATPLAAALSQELPYEIAGFSTHFSAPDPDDNGTQLPQPIEEGPVRHRVEIHTLAGFIQAQLNFDLAAELEPADWLSFSEQRLLGLVAGAVYQDDLGLEVVRARFNYYPHDVWLYLQLAGWARIGQEEHLMGRAGYAGDELGSALIAGRLARDIMRLRFLQEQRYAPYPKWFGSAFRQLPGGPELAPVLQAALSAQGWQAREAHLVVAYETLAHCHNALALAEPLPETVRDFFNRPFKVITFNGYAEQLRGLIADPRVARLAARRPIGMIDQFSDSTDLLSDPAWRPLLRRLYE